MCDLADKDPFRKPNKIVIKNIGGPSATSRMKPEALGKVMDVLFPEGLTLMVTPTEVNEDDVSLLRSKEMNCAVEQLRPKKTKAPGSAMGYQTTCG